MPSTTTPSASARTSSAGLQYHHASPITAMAIAMPVEPAGITAAELMREEVEALSSHMLWLRSWWQAHEDGIRAADSRAASSVHDHFVDAAIFARGIARAADLEMNEQRMRDYRWGRTKQSLRLVVGGAA